MFLCVLSLSVIAKSSDAPSAIFSSAAVNLPLFRIIPPTLPSPRSRSVFSRSVTSCPCFTARTAAAHPDQPAPITTILLIEKFLPPYICTPSRLFRLCPYGCMSRISPDRSTYLRDLPQPGIFRLPAQPLPCF